jgi:hypothetical protein
VFYGVAAVGDSKIADKLSGLKVCYEGGPVSAGTLLCTCANHPGFLKAQDDGVIRSKTVGKAMESVVFDHDGLASVVYGYLYCG